MTDRTARRRRDEQLRALGELLGEALATPTANGLVPEARAAAHRLAGGGALLAPRADWARDILRAAVVCTLLTSTDDATVPHLHHTLLTDVRG